MESIFEIIEAFGLALVFFLSPLLFIGSCIVSIFSKGTRDRIKRQKWLFAAWGFVSLLCVALMAPGRGHGNVARRAWTNNEIDQIHTAILNYEMEYGQPPPAVDNADIIKELGGDNSRKIEFISLKPQNFNDKGEVVDIWGTPLRISIADPEHPVIQSAGPDGKWNTRDDLNTEKKF